MFAVVRQVAASYTRFWRRLVRILTPDFDLNFYVTTNGIRSTIPLLLLLKSTNLSSVRKILSRR